MRDESAEISTTDERPELPAKARAILAGAMREFLAHGYAGTSMDRVAAAAGVSKQTVYSYYRDKDRLFTALIEHLAREKRQAIFTPEVAAPGDAPRAVLRRVIVSMLVALTEDPELVAFIRLIVGESGRFPLLAQAFVREIDTPVIAALAAYLATRPELTVPDTTAAARVIFGTLFYTAMMRHVLGGEEVAPDDAERLVTTLLDLLIRAT